jgi:hypothetical protein
MGTGELFVAEHRLSETLGRHTTAALKKLSFFWVVAFAVIANFSNPTFVSAEEPAEEFLQALREVGYFDVAIRYLDGAADSELVNPEFRKKIPYEKSKTLFNSIKTIRDPELQEKRLNEVDVLLTQYASTVSDNLEATEVLKFQNDVRYVRGRNYLSQSNSKLADEARKAALVENARKVFGEAIPGYRKVRELQGDQIKNFQIDPEDPKSNDKLRLLRSSFVQTRLRIPEVMEKFASTWQEGEAERVARMGEAGAEYLAVAKLYDESYDQGRIAKAWAARCYQQAGDYGKSGDLLNEVFKYPSPSKRLLREALSVGVETWPKLKPYPTDQVLKAAEIPVQLLSRDQKRDPVWLRIQLELAKAKYEKSIEVKASDSAESNRLKKEATRLAREIAQRRNPHSELAAEWMNSWGMSMRAAKAEPESFAPPENFDEARQRSKEQIASIEAMLRDVSAQSQKISRMPEGEEKTSQTQALAESRESMNGAIDQTLSLLQSGIAMADETTSRSDLNNLRYLQAYCYFAKERYPEAAVIGSFLLQKYPTVDWSQQAAGLMVRSYERLYDDADDDEKPAAKQRVVASAIGMLDLWPNSKDSAVAATAVTRVAVLEKDFATAKQYFDRIPAGSPVRSQLASRIGQEIWGSRKTANSDAEKKEIAKQANQFLSAAVEGVEVSAMDFSTAVAALYHVDACRELGELDRAISQIEVLLQGLDSNETFGKSVKFRQSAYNTALNTFLDAMRTKPDTQQWIDKSQDVIAKLSSEAAGDPQAEALANAVFRKVAGELMGQFESLPNLTAKEKFADSMQSFFGGIGTVSKDVKTRLWAGSTLLSIADSLSFEGGKVRARDISVEAIKALDAAKKAGFAGDAKLELRYRHQLALAQRGSGKYKESVESFEKILESSNGVNLQIDAAKTLLIWGIEAKDGTALTRSMNGTGEYKDAKTGKKKKRIWGWKTLVGLTRGNEKFFDAFRESEYYSILCRVRYGEIMNKPQAIVSARKELGKVMKRFPNLATGSWKAKYEQLSSDLNATKK